MNLRDTGFADRYAIYTRVSTDGQEDNTSPEGQMRACERYAEQQGWEAASPKSWYHDTVSGTKKGIDRKMLAEVYDLIEEKKIKHVIIKRVDRIGRDAAVIREIIKAVYDLGGKVSIADKGRTYKNYRECEKDIKFEGFFAQYERDNIVEKNLEGRINQFNRGSALGKQAFGYRTELDPNQKTKFRVVVINPSEADSLVDFLSHFADKKNIKEAIDYSIEKGYRVRSGGYFTHHFFRDTLKLLDKYNGRPIEETYSFDEEVFNRTISYPKIVSDGLYARVMEAYSLKNKASKGKFEGIRPFGGLVSCSCCGEVATVRVKNIKRREGYSTFIVGCSSYGRNVQRAYRNEGKSNNPDCAKTFRYTDLVTALMKFLDEASELGLEENYSRELSKVLVKLNTLLKHVNLYTAERDNLASEKEDLRTTVNTLIKIGGDAKSFIDANKDRIEDIEIKIEDFSERIKGTKKEYNRLAEMLTASGLPITPEFVQSVYQRQNSGVGGIVGMAFAALARGEEEFELPDEMRLEEVVLPDVVNQLAAELAEGLRLLKGLVQAGEWAEVNSLLYRLGIRFYADFNTPKGEEVEVSVVVNLSDPKNVQFENTTRGHALHNIPQLREALNAHGVPVQTPDPGPEQGRLL